MDNADPQTLLSPALMAEVEAAAAAERRPTRELLRDAVELYLDRRSLSGDWALRSPQEAATRVLARRARHQLPAGMSIRDLMTHGRA